MLNIKVLLKVTDNLRLSSAYVSLVTLSHVCVCLYLKRNPMGETRMVIIKELLKRKFYADIFLSRSCTTVNTILLFEVNSNKETSAIAAKEALYDCFRVW